MDKFNLKAFSKYYNDIGNTILEYEANLAELLESCNYDYGKVCLHIIEWVEITFVNHVIYSIPFVVFEGDRCSGKDTIINDLSTQSHFVPLPRKTNNASWKILNERKQNCYFKLNNPIESILLWYSDLAYRISSWRLNDFDKIYLVNRYTDSICVCIKSNYNLSSIEKQHFSTLMDKFKELFPIPRETIVLDITQDTQNKRLLKNRGRVFSEEEKLVAIRNIKFFNDIHSENVCHIDANKPFETVRKMVLKHMEHLKNK